MDELSAQIRNCMYQYSRAIYRSIKELIDPYADPEEQLEFRRSVLLHCEETMERLVGRTQRMRVRPMPGGNGRQREHATPAAWLVHDERSERPDIRLQQH